MKNLLKPLFTRQWIITTILAVIASGVMVRLGIWQLNRLEQRRALNSRILAQIDAPQLTLDDDVLAQGTDLCAMEYRQVQVTGEYAPAQQTSWRNQVYHDQLGVSLLTPLVISGTEQAVLVNRGWIPAEDADPSNWAQYDQPGEVTVQGVIRCSQTDTVFNMKPDPTLEPGQNGLDAWSYINIERISQQVDLPLLPVYIHQYPAEGQPELPASMALDIEITEGPHQSYAIQWFSFATALLVGYPFYVQNQAKKHSEKE